MLIRDPVNDKTEIYGLSCSVWIFKCFKWDAFKTIFYIKNERVLELFNFYGTLVTKMYLNQYKQNKKGTINNNNGDNSKSNKNDDGNTIIIIIVIMIIIVIIRNSLLQPGDFSAGSTADNICKFFLM